MCLSLLKCCTLSTYCCRWLSLIERLPKNEIGTCAINELKIFIKDNNSVVIKQDRVEPSLNFTCALSCRVLYPLKELSSSLGIRLQFYT